MNVECSDQEDQETEMTIFYFDNNLKCGQFNAVCNQMTKTSIPTLNYPPLTKSTSFIAGFKKILGIPKVDLNNDDGVSGKQGTGFNDDHYRGTATIATIWMPIIVFIASLTMLVNL